MIIKNVFKCSQNSTTESPKATICQTKLSCEGASGYFKYLVLFITRARNKNDTFNIRGMLKNT